MPYKPRAEHSSGVYHVYSRGNRKQDIFVDDHDRRRYLALLESVIGRTRWMCMAYCLMGNHMHLLIETREPNLGAGMQRLHGGYARYFNRRHRLSGHLFQRRYDAVPIVGDTQFWATAAYIARNPVAAGLCSNATDWLWSSHADIVLGCAPSWLAADRLLSYFKTDGGQGLTQYLELVEFSKSGQA